MLWYAYTNLCKARCVDHVCVATNDMRIAGAVIAFGGEAVMTDARWENSAELSVGVCQELMRKRGVHFDVVVNLDCNEPFIQPHHIETVADIVVNSDVEVAIMGKDEALKSVSAILLQKHRRADRSSHYKRHT